MLTTYAVQRTRHGWTLTVEYKVGASFAAPSVLSHHTTRKAALTVARLLAGRTGRVVTF